MQDQCIIDKILHEIGIPYYFWNLGKRQGATGGPLLLFFSSTTPIAESPLRKGNPGGISRWYKGHVRRLIRRAAATTPAPKGADSPTPTRKYGNIRRDASHRLRVRPR